MRQKVPNSFQARENLIYSSTSQQRTNKWYWDNQLTSLKSETKSLKIPTTKMNSKCIKYLNTQIF